jgi:hypothetical protein
MSLNNAKHIIAEIDGTRCSVAETGTTLERAAFLRMLLEFNGFEVRELQIKDETEGSDIKYTIGVTDLLFNPVFAVYERQLKTPEGGYASPGYWNQECTECDPMYWMRGRKNIKPPRHAEV